MQELHAVLDQFWSGLPTLKQHSLLFDKFHVLGPTDHRNSPEPSSGERRNEFKFLVANGVLDVIPQQTTFDANVRVPDVEERKNKYLEIRKSLNISSYEALQALPLDAQMEVLPFPLRQEFKLRTLAAILKNGGEVDAVPVFPSNGYPFWEVFQIGQSQPQPAVSIALDYFPVPGKSDAWQDILDFKSEMAD